jgi:hypothetical protein
MGRWATTFAALRGALTTVTIDDNCATQIEPRAHLSTVVTVVNGASLENPLIIGVEPRVEKTAVLDFETRNTDGINLKKPALGDTPRTVRPKS